MINNNFAYVRNDLIESHLAVPVGNSYYLEQTPLLYRWKDDDSFEVYLKGDWHKAYSIDWEFYRI